MAPTVFKKREGVLKLSRNQEVVTWTPSAPPGSKPEVTVPVKNITNLQQTPASSAKVKLKIFAQTGGAVEPVTYTFDFTSPTKARDEAGELRDALSTAISALKTESNPLAALGDDAAIPVAGSAGPGPSRPSQLGDVEAWYDDKKLLTNDGLQRSLLQADRTLSTTFMESLRSKPEAISMLQFTTQFWASRAPLLRQHAIEAHQAPGAYNVLSHVKPRVEDSRTKLNITKEQIHLLFAQHPLVKRVYDENVPRLSERDFWARFFQSRLLKKLKGEKVTEADAQDALFDKYLSYDDSAGGAVATGYEQRRAAQHVPHIIDLAGNEENHSQRQGNAPDLLMRPQRVPIVRALNSLSEKLLLHVAPNDVDPSAPIGMDEVTFNELALRDLQGDAEETRAILRLRDKDRFFGRSAADADDDPALAKYTHQDRVAAVEALRADLAGAADRDLGVALGFDDASSSSSDDEGGTAARRSAHVGSKASLRAASRQVSAAVAAQRALLAADADADVGGDASLASAAHYGLSTAVFEQALITQATTSEFVAQFWAAFLSGDERRVDEVRHLVETLDRSMERTAVVADEAEAERKAKVEEQRAKLEEYYRRKGKRRAFDASSIKGGAKAVRQLMEPTVEAINRASQEYAKALKKQKVLAAEL